MRRSNLVLTTILVYGTMILAAGIGCHRDNQSMPTRAAVPDAFSATYEVQSIQPGDYSQYIVTLNRPAPPDRSGNRFVGTWMELKTFLQPDLKAALEPGTTVVISIRKARQPVGGFICRCGNMCMARRGGICQGRCGCPINH